MLRGGASAALMSRLCFWLPQENYYRPPGQDACLPCDCFPHGSHSRVCDMDSGQCSCKPGVIGRQCNRCDNPFAEVTVLGCEGLYLSTCSGRAAGTGHCVSASEGCVCTRTRALHSPGAWGAPDSLGAQLCLLGFLRLALQAAWVSACVPLPSPHTRGGGARGPVLGGAGLPSGRNVRRAPHTCVPG